MDEFGQVVLIDDVDGDGIGDITTGAFYADVNGMTAAGKQYLFYGGDIAVGVHQTPGPHLPQLTNYPNPFSSTTWIVYDQTASPNTTIEIYNVAGQRIREIPTPGAPPGLQKVLWDGTDRFGRRVASGVYFYRVVSGDRAQTQKMILLR